MALQKIFPSAGGYFAVGRQRGQGQPRLYNLYKLLNVSVTPKHASNMSTLGIEVGSGTISEQRSQKENYMPEMDINAHLRVGAMMNLLCMAGYRPVSVGTDPGSPVTTTLGAAVTSRHTRAVTLTSISSISVGDWLQTGALVTPGSPVSSDVSEVHEVVSVGSTNAVQVLTIVNATGGTYKLTLGGAQTSGLAYNANASAIQTALQGLSTGGSGNITVSGTNPFTITGTSALAGVDIDLITVDDSALTGTGAYAYITESAVGCGASQVAFKGRLLNTYADSTAVKKVDNTKAVTHYFFHIQPDNAHEGDLYTLYWRTANSDGSVEDIYTDVAAANFSPSFSNGQIATMTSSLKALDTSRALGWIRTVYSTLIADPGSKSVNNTRGSFSLLGDTINAPRQVGFQLNAEIYDDVVLTQFKKQSNVHIGHTLSATSGGKFVKAFFDTIIYGGSTSTIVTDSIPESTFDFTAQSAQAISTGVYPSFRLYAPNCQFAGYDPQLNTNQPVSANMEMIKIVPNSSTGTDDWRFEAVNTCNTDVYSAY